MSEYKSVLYNENTTARNRLEESRLARENKFQAEGGDNIRPIKLYLQAKDIFSPFVQ
jgi:hypothetical protein